MRMNLVTEKSCVNCTVVCTFSINYSVYFIDYLINFFESYVKQLQRRARWKKKRLLEFDELLNGI